MLFLEIEDIIANAIIEKNKIDGSRSISVHKAEEYGEYVCANLRNQGFHAKMKLSRDLTRQFQDKYQDFFYAYYLDNDFIFSLQKDKEINDLIINFRGYLPLEVLVALTNKTVLEKAFSESLNIQHLKQVKKLTKPNN